MNANRGDGPASARRRTGPRRVAKGVIASAGAGTWRNPSPERASGGIVHGGSSASCRATIASPCKEREGSHRASGSSRRQWALLRRSRRPAATRSSEHESIDQFPDAPHLSPKKAATQASRVLRPKGSCDSSPNSSIVMKGNRAVYWLSARAHNSNPGRIAPPSKAPSAESESTVVAVPVSMMIAGRCGGRMTLQATALESDRCRPCSVRPGRSSGESSTRLPGQTGEGKSDLQLSSTLATPEGLLPATYPPRRRRGPDRAGPNCGQEMDGHDGRPRRRALGQLAAHAQQGIAAEQAEFRAAIADVNGQQEFGHCRPRSASTSWRIADFQVTDGPTPGDHGQPDRQSVHSA